MTGGPGGWTFSAWGGYISGVTLVLEPDRRIVQTWRTSEFSAAEDSLHHTGVPDGQTHYEISAWSEHYFTPMAEWYSR